MSFIYRTASAISRAVGRDSALMKAGRPLAERLVRWSVGRQGLAWNINRVPCRIDPKYRAELARTYDAHLAERLERQVRPGQVCLDVGANIGAWVIQFGHWVGPTGRVVAFEPNPAARAVLETHVRLNDLGGRTTVVPAAAGDVPGEVTFFAAGADGMSRVGSPNPTLRQTTESLTVPVVTLDQWCERGGVVPDWLLIDVEGYEGHVLAGATKLLRDRGPALGVVVEMHPSLFASVGMTADEFAARVTAAGRRVVPLSGQSDPLAEYGHVLLEVV